MAGYARKAEHIHITNAVRVMVMHEGHIHITNAVGVVVMYEHIHITARTTGPVMALKYSWTWSTFHILPEQQVRLWH